jgi:GNAT superfamily N-acetyltransferase
MSRKECGVRIEAAPAVQIVPVEQDDAETIAALAGVIWRAHYADIITAAQIEYMLQQRYAPAQIRAEIACGDVAWDKLLVDGVLAGYASYYMLETAGGRAMKLDKLYMHHDFQRHGYGGRLFARALAAAQAAGCKTLMLAVNKANAKALAAYAKYGFRIREAVAQDIGGGFVMDDYIMVKDV